MNLGVYYQIDSQRLKIILIALKSCVISLQRPLQASSFVQQTDSYYYVLGTLVHWIYKDEQGRESLPICVIKLQRNFGFLKSSYPLLLFHGSPL